MKKLFIVNPTSGQGLSLEIIKRLEKKCKENNEDYKIVYTEKKDDATKIATYYKDFGCRIYSVGGDGTLNEIVNGLIGGTSFLTVIPAGSGNDFYKTISNYEEKIFDIDVGKVNDKYFINSASIGLDAIIGENVSLMKKIHIPRSQIYNASIIYTLINFKPIEIKINDVYEKITLLAVTNGQYYGSGFRITPDASINDGYLNLCMAKKLNKLQIPPMLLKLIKENHYEDKHVITKRIKNLKITSNKDLICGIDGELLKGKDFDFNIIEGGIKYNNENNYDIKRLIMSR
ncbi:MAG: diacylglycerol kinase family lipid kinase [Bacilli bacterium]